MAGGRHDGPVWQVAWAHPRFGHILASCSYDRQVFVWKEVETNVWAPIYKYAGHEQSGPLPTDTPATLLLPSFEYSQRSRRLVHQ